MANLTERTDELIKEFKENKKFKENLKEKTISLNIPNFEEALKDIKNQYELHYTRKTEGWNVLCSQHKDYTGKSELMAYMEKGKEVNVLCYDSNVYKILSNSKDKLPDFL